jgi:hypothetical protein
MEGLSAPFKAPSNHRFYGNNRILAKRRKTVLLFVNIKKNLLILVADTILADLLNIEGN